MKRGKPLGRRTPLRTTKPLKVKRISIVPGKTTTNPRKRREQIRSLRRDEEIPAGTPKRYRDGRGYIRLRWLVETNLYVEEYEHRIVTGRPEPEFDVHHINGVKDDNRPENLQVLTKAEHTRLHENWVDRPPRPKGRGQYWPYPGKEAKEKAERRLAREADRRREVEQMADLYRQGKTTTEIGKIVGIDESNVYRRLAQAGIKMRSPIDYAKQVDAAEIASRYEAGRSIKGLARDYRISTARVDHILAAAGVAKRRPGRPSNRDTGGYTEREGRRVVKRRSKGVCEVCGAAPAEEWQHRKNRSQLGSWAPSNGLHVCSKDHRYIHQHPTEAYENGWSVESWDNPETRQVLRRGRWAILNNAGGVDPAPRELGGAA